MVVWPTACYRRQNLYPRLASPPLPSPPLASPRLASPRLASPPLASPRLPSPRLAFQLLSRNKDKCVAVDALVPAGAIGDYGLYDDEEDGAEDEDALDDPVMKVLY